MERLIPALEALFNDHRADDGALFDGLCQSLIGLGLPLWRDVMQFPMLHPLYLGHTLYWWRDQGVSIMPRPHGFEESAEFLESPYKASLDRDGPLRVHLMDLDDPGLPLLRELKAKGGTDFINALIPAHGMITPGVSWTSDAPGGFTENDIALLTSLTSFLGPPFALRAERRTVRIMLETYLGAGPGKEVLGGAVQHGDTRKIEAVILQTDLRGFNAKSLAWPPSDLLAELDAYFEAVVDAVHYRGGDVLKFIGDGVLAVFPVDVEVTAPTAARNAMVAIQRAFADLDESNRKLRARWGGEPLTMAASLDIGSVVYGNIGGRSCLDFTVIGPAVNRGSRILDHAKNVGRPVVVSAAINDLLGDGLQPLGTHQLDGLNEATALFANQDKS
ncbi:MAG: adenylate/guanylate cyclase domain-containing protein [Pseudomonadota bacterium]